MSQPLQVIEGGKDEQSVAATAVAECDLGRRSALGYTGVSLTAALAFVATATLVGGYSEVARFGGAVWVFLLSMIVTMPLVTSWIKRRARRERS